MAAGSDSMTIGVRMPRKRTLKALPWRRRPSSRKAIGRTSQRSVWRAGGAEGPGGSDGTRQGSQIAGPCRTRRRVVLRTMEADALWADRYRVTRRLGSGGAASVWAAEDERLGRTVAIKRLHVPGG